MIMMKKMGRLKKFVNVMHFWVHLLQNCAFSQKLKCGLCLVLLELVAFMSGERLFSACFWVRPNFFFAESKCLWFTSFDVRGVCILSLVFLLIFSPGGSGVDAIITFNSLLAALSACQNDPSIRHGIIDGAKPIFSCMMEGRPQSTQLSNS
jgi:hypothetical protein